MKFFKCNRSTLGYMNRKRDIFKMNENDQEATNLKEVEKSMKFLVHQ